MGVIVYSYTGEALLYICTFLRSLKGIHQGFVYETTKLPHFNVTNFIYITVDRIVDDRFNYPCRSCT